ncbi:MAG TPA: peptide ABC transporter substrate-binding protein [Anaeromyxobacter sp.]|nr:peptide ABC transporter substrate-binding protein [Anaeromyxobacter sp.]
MGVCRVASRTIRGNWSRQLLALVATLPLVARADQVVRLAITEDPPQLDSTRSNDTESAFVLGHVEEGLVTYGQHGDLRPGVAESWDIRETGATFRLRGDARWSDGRPVTAQDFVFAWRKVVDPATASEYAFVMYTLKNGQAINAGRLPATTLGVRAVDDRTLEVEFERPCPYFLGLVAIPTFDPVREDFYRSRQGRYGATPTDLLFDGPFVLSHWDHEASLTLDRNPLYWDARAVRLDRIEIPYITNDPNARLNLFRDGSIDFLRAIGRDESRRAEVERLPMKSFAQGSPWFLAFNHRPGRATANAHLRRAIQLAYDPREFISAVIGIPGARPAAGIIPSWTSGVKEAFRKEHPLPPLRPDLTEARRELELARQELGGKIPPLSWLTFTTAGSAREAEYFQYVLKKRLGLDVVIDKQTFKQVLAKENAGDFDIAVTGWVPDYDDPMTFADLFASWNANNHGAYRDGRYDALVRAAQSEADPAKRMSDLARAERIAIEALAVLPLYEDAYVYLQSLRVQGIVRHRIGPDPDLTHARISEEEPFRAWSATR